MASETLRSRSFLLAVLGRALLLVLLATALIQLLAHTRYFATALVVVLCAVALVGDLVRLIARENRAAERFLDAISGSALETPLQRSAMPSSLRTAYERALGRLGQDRSQQQQQGQYLQTLLDTVPSGLVVLQPDGHMHVVNRAAHRILGEAATRLQDLPSVGLEAAAQLAALPPGTHRIVQMASGRRVLASAALFVTPDAPAQRLVSLQRVVGDLDAVELKAWDDMARVLAHEMMNSLTPIASLSQSLDGLMQAGNHEEVAASLEAITRRSQGLMRFVERYRKVADLPDPQLQRLSLSDLLNGIDRLVRPALDEKRIGFSIRVEPEQITLLADADLLEQALINLLRNAADAVAGMAEPRIVVSCRLVDDRCLIDVQDNGPGLTALQREQIFVPFFTTKPGGSGIGLSLARRIAQSHGGRMEILANDPCGCVFRLSLASGDRDISY